jgi:hypothetical protein
MHTHSGDKQLAGKSLSVICIHTVACPEYFFPQNAHKAGRAHLSWSVGIWSTFSEKRDWTVKMTINLHLVLGLST